MNDQNDINVTLGGDNEDSIEYFPCPTCFEMLDLRYDKKSHPYFICDDCGMQLFIRGKKGIKKLKNLIPNYKNKVKSHKLIEIIDYIEELNAKLSEIEAKKPFFGEDKNLNIQEKVINKQLKSLQKALNNWDI